MIGRRLVRGRRRTQYENKERVRVSVKKNERRGRGDWRLGIRRLWVTR
jgi:hypothetical protein